MDSINHNQIKKFNDRFLTKKQDKTLNNIDSIALLHEKILSLEKQNQKLLFERKLLKEKNYQLQQKYDKLVNNNTKKNFLSEIKKGTKLWFFIKILEKCLKSPLTVIQNINLKNIKTLKNLIFTENLVNTEVKIENYLRFKKDGEKADFVFMDKVSDTYFEWIRYYDRLNNSDRKKIDQHIKTFKYKPLISIIMPHYNCPEKWLRIALDSVISQLSHHSLPKHSTGYFGRALLTQNFSAVTGACMLMRSEVFNEVKGFDKKLRVEFNDLDICLRITEKGYRILWTPYSELYHMESASRVRDSELIKYKDSSIDKNYFISKWGHILENDPFYNPNLALEKSYFSLAFPPRVKKPWLNAQFFK